ncbi:MAG: DUF4386 domain-containing protein [Chloroflexales bacterium]|nr:DUF4386 domain-containing protein [Chloroflexales bacterium]
MKAQETSFRWIGWLLVASALITTVGVIVRGATLGPISAPVDEVLTRLAANRTIIVSITYIMAIGQLIRIPISLGLHTYLERRKMPHLMIFTAFGILSGLMLTLDYYQWPFLNARLADLYTASDADAVTRRAVEVAYSFSYFGDGFGGNLGWLGMIIWGVGVSVIMWQTEAFPRWIAGVGLAASLLMIPNYLEFIGNPPLLDTLGLVGQILINFWFLAMGVRLLLRPTVEGAMVAPLSPA